MFPRVIAEYQPGKVATTDTRQTLIRGSLRVTLALDASGPERATAFVPASTATAVAETARPFTTVSVVAECRSGGRAAEEPLGACAGDSSGPDVGAPVGSGAGAVSDELGADVPQAGAMRQVRLARHEKVLAGQLEQSRPVGMAQPQSRHQPATGPRSTTTWPRRQRRPRRSHRASKVGSNSP